MRAVVQRVSHASVTIHGSVHGEIGHGLLILLGIEINDTQEDVEWLMTKIAGLRILNDEDNKMNLSVKDVDGEFLLISQFTLHASTAKGNRPSFIKAARPELAMPLYENSLQFLQALSNRKIQTGVFGADMQVELLNDGPVTVFIDSKNRE